MHKFIPVYQPDLSGNEYAYTADCISSTWISSKGSYIEKFENGFIDFSGIKHGTTVSNGTVALHIALLSLGIGPGDEVIVPTLTYIASVNAIRYTGAKPVFVDSDAETWQMNPDFIEKKITKNTRAIMAVHLYGQPCDMNKIIEIAKRNSLFIIEDCAEAIGSYIDGKHVGNFSDVGTFSFFGNKTITTGEGGMVLSNHSHIIDLARRLKGQGLAEGREYWHDIVGYNYRMTNICAAIGYAQLEKIDHFLERKKSIAGLYKKLLKNCPISIQQGYEGSVNSYWMFTILVKKPDLRDKLRSFLKNSGVETRPVFFPVHTMPMYKTNELFQVASDVASRGINLPSWPGLSDEDIDYIATLINKFYS